MNARAWWRAVLVASVTISISGNVYHALLTAPDGLRIPAAIMSALPPLAVFGVTEGLMRSAGAGVRTGAYWAGVAGGVGIALIAFVLSFWALRSLAVMMGEPPGVAAGIPLLADLLVAVSSVMLLSFRPMNSAAAVDVPTLDDVVVEPHPARAVHAFTAAPIAAAEAPAAPAAAETTAVSVPAPQPVEREPAPKTMSPPPIPLRAPEPVSPASVVEPEPAAAPVPQAADRRADVPRGVTPITAARTSIDRNGHYMTMAKDLMSNGLRVRRGPELVAKVLHDRDNGMNPTAMAEAHEVHHSVVTRILAAADQRAG
ncbi:DUF2637 domain-containing protein [Mycolicibacterium llatzerense]|uniref:DUF2637 domain-containing protein n=1 Tax=Mycolicibacterium llatzerense TaxID=280871 RepID=UPI0031D92A9E